MLRYPKLILTAVFVLIILVFFDYSNSKIIFLNAITSAFKKNFNINIKAKNFSFIWLGVRLDSVEVTFPKTFLQLKIDTADVTCSVFKLKCQANLELYKGFAKVSFNKKKIVEFSVKNINLNLHPFLYAHGIKTGMLSSDGKLIEIKDLAKDTNSTLSPSLTGLPLPIEIGQLNAKIIRTDYFATKDSLILENIHIDSDLISIPPPKTSNPIKNTVIFTGKNISQLSISFILTPKGLTYFKNYLQFICPPTCLTEPKTLNMSFNLGKITCQVANS